MRVKVAATMALLAILSPTTASFAKGSTSHSVSVHVSSKGVMSYSTRDTASTGTGTTATGVKAYHNTPRINGHVGKVGHGGEMSNQTIQVNTQPAPNYTYEPLFKPDPVQKAMDRERIQELIKRAIKHSDAQPRPNKKGGCCCE